MATEDLELTLKDVELMGSFVDMKGYSFFVIRDRYTGNFITLNEEKWLEIKANSEGN